MDEMNRDPELAAALRDLRGEPPAMDWEAMRARVSASAELSLARRRRARPLARGLRTVLPLAVAAGIAAVALTALPGREDRLSQADQAMVEEILDLSVPGEVGALMNGEAADEALLEAVDAPGQQ
jgi:hypothetical protein